MVSEIFEHHCITILFPELQIRLLRIKDLLKLPQLRGYILMDGLAQHFVDYVDEASFELGVHLH